MRSEALTESLRALSRREGATLFMTLLAAFKLLLYRHAEQEDIVVGVPIANRNRLETEGLIGFFINTLALRTDLSGAPSFRELLARTRRVTLDACAHQDLPFEKLVEELKPHQDLSRNPLFDVFFNYNNVPKATANAPGLALAWLDPPEIDAKFSMTLYVFEGERALDL